MEKGNDLDFTWPDKEEGSNQNKELNIPKFEDERFQPDGNNDVLSPDFKNSISAKGEVHFDKALEKFSSKVESDPVENSDGIFSNFRARIKEFTKTRTGKIALLAIGFGMLANIYQRSSENSSDSGKTPDAVSSAELFKKENSSDLDKIREVVNKSTEGDEELMKIQKEFREEPSILDKAADVAEGAIEKVDEVTGLGKAIDYNYDNPELNQTMEAVNNPVILDRENVPDAITNNVEEEGQK